MRRALPVNATIKLFSFDIKGVGLSCGLVEAVTHTLGLLWLKNTLGLIIKTIKNSTLRKITNLLKLT